MIVDPNERLLSFLQAALPAATIWAGVNYPPEGYSPATNGTGIAFRVRGGDLPEEEDHVQPSVQFKVYGPSERDAWQAYMGLTEVLDAPADSHVVWADIDGGLGAQLKEIDTEWDYVLAFYRIRIRNQ